MVSLTVREARRLFYDILAGNLMATCILFAAIILVPWSSVKILLLLTTLSIFVHTFQVKRLLYKKKRKNDGPSS